MYQDLFDQQQQELMRSFFENLSKKGKVKKIARAEQVNLVNKENFAIVVSGQLKQSLYSKAGSKKSLYLLRRGEIFGEMDYFSCGQSNLITEAREDSIISIIASQLLEKELAADSGLYRYFIHSITRKFRIVMLQMADLVFNDSAGKLAGILIRLAAQEGKKTAAGIMIDSNLTHQELAYLIGCSRATVTRGLNNFKQAGLITLSSDKKIIILSSAALAKYADSSLV